MVVLVGVRGGVAVWLESQQPTCPQVRQSRRSGRAAGQAEPQVGPDVVADRTVDDIHRPGVRDTSGRARGLAGAQYAAVQASIGRRDELVTDSGVVRGSRCV